MADRARGAMVACLVCDAAATGVQWIYDLDTLQQLQQQRDAGQVGGVGGVAGLVDEPAAYSPYS